MADLETKSGTFSGNGRNMRIKKKFKLFCEAKLNRKLIIKSSRLTIFGNNLDRICPGLAPVLQPLSCDMLTLN